MAYEQVTWALGTPYSSPPNGTLHAFEAFLKRLVPSQEMTVEQVYALMLNDPDPQVRALHSLHSAVEYDFLMRLARRSEFIATASFVRRSIEKHLKTVNLSTDELLKLLCVASQFGSADMVAVALTYGVSVDNDALTRAAKSGVNRSVQLLLGAGANPWRDDSAALHWASRLGHLAVVKQLVSHVKRAKRYVNSERTEALRWAAAENQVPVVKYLLSAGADIHAEHDESLRYAAINGHSDVVDFLLNNGANVHANEEEALRFSSRHGFLVVVTHIVGSGAKVRARGDEALRWAAMMNQVDVVAFLLEKGADPRAVTFGRSDAVQALLTRYEEKEECAIKSGASATLTVRRLRYVTVFDQYLGTLKHWDYTEIVAHVQSTPELSSVLQWTVRLTYTELFEIVDSDVEVHHVARFIELLYARVPTAIADENARAIVYLAIKRNYVSLVRVAINAGANIDDVLQSAIDLQRTKIMAVAIERGAVPNRTNIMAAVTRGDAESLRLLIGPSSDCVDAVVAHLALESGHRDIVSMLLKHGDVDVEWRDTFSGKTLTEAARGTAMEDLFDV